MSSVSVDYVAHLHLNTSDSTKYIQTYLEIENLVLQVILKVKKFTPKSKFYSTYPYFFSVF